MYLYIISDSDHNTPQEIRTGLLSAVAIAIQFGNARIITDGGRKLIKKAAAGRLHN